MMTLAIMQPYFLPYLGYFQLMSAVDEFVVYDNIEFTKKGWINRNRILSQGKDEYITLPLKKDSDYLNIDRRCLAEIWPGERRKLINKMKESYRKAPYFSSIMPFVEDVLNFDDENLFEFLYNSIDKIRVFLQIETRLVVSSTIEIDHSLKGEDKVLAICQARGAKAYINPPGGVDLYNRDHFSKRGLSLSFIKMNDLVYKQFDEAFVPALSIIDVLMFNSADQVQKCLRNGYILF
jgi:WbqC-like protein family